MERITKMTDNVTSKKSSLIGRIHQLTSAAILVGGLLVGGTAQATVSRPSSVLDRAIAVQNAMKEKVHADTNATKDLPRAQVLLAQWGNNWFNTFNNYMPWFNFMNWGNF
jgi:hypothetical protein